MSSSYFYKSSFYSFVTRPFLPFHAHFVLYFPFVHFQTVITVPFLLFFESFILTSLSPCSSYIYFPLSRFHVLTIFLLGLHALLVMLLVKTLSPLPRVFLINHFTSPHKLEGGDASSVPAGWMFPRMMCVWYVCMRRREMRERKSQHSVSLHLSSSYLISTAVAESLAGFSPWAKWVSLSSWAE